MHPSSLVLYFLTFSTILCSNDTSSRLFDGYEWWDEFQDICEDENWGNVAEYSGAICVTYIRNFQLVKMEILSWEPALVIYRDLIRKDQVENYLLFLEDVQFEEQRVTDDSGDFSYSKVRKANGSFIIPEEHPASNSIFQSLKYLIPDINFDAAEDFSALSYQPGGHYAVHFDYFDYESEENWDEWMRCYGNRLATLIMVFKTAEDGGDTVFPALETRVKPNVGDAYFWFNARGDGSQEQLAAHGGCPIHRGNKIITTIWIRMAYQQILEKIDNPGSITADLVIPEWKLNI